MRDDRSCCTVRARAHLAQTIARPKHLRPAYLSARPARDCSRQSGCCRNLRVHAIFTAARSRTERWSARLGATKPSRHHCGASGCRLPCFGPSPLPCRQSRRERTSWDVPLSEGGSALQGHIRRRDRRDRGSTSSMSAATAPSAAGTVASASGSSGAPRISVRPAAVSFVRPRSAGVRPRAALPLARTARRPSPASSPPWPSTPTCCPAT